ncbi:MAG: MBL fold metallo-hydrolase [Acidobacteria bacterium]|nr:MBL fold metallo-hydrolase [Acidobacteriota bacterium]TDI22417.1 MAG: MBL fold metallo-hydrolase [Acidobacteriota bacterium]
MGSRSTSLTVAAAFVIAATAATIVVVTGQQPAPPLGLEQVKDGLYMVTGSGGNVGIRVTSEGVILIDNKFPQNFGEIQKKVAEVTDQPVRYVINTHHHGDHSGGNVEYIKFAQVIAHQNARVNMIRGNQPAPPQIVYTDQTAVFLGGVEVQAHYLGQGHTNGDSVIYFPDLRTIHGGDLLHGIAPFIDYGNGGSSAGWVTTLTNILQLDFDTAIPGHGALMTRDDVTAFRTQMQAVRARMTRLIGEGVTKEQASERIKTPELSWTQAENGLFMRRSLPGFYDEVAAEQ